MFVRFSDLGPFKSIVNSNPQYVNAPRNLLLDRQGRIVGSRTQADYVPSIAPTPPAPASVDVEEFEDAIISELVRRRLKNPAVRRKIKKSAMTALQKIRAIQAAVLAGIEESNEGDDVVAARKTEEEAKGAGLPAREAKAAGVAAGKAVRKHMRMETQEASSIAKDVVEETKTPSSSGSRRGRPAGSKSRVAESPALAGKTKSELSGIVKKLGLAVLGRNKGQMIDQITEVSDLSNKPIELLVEAGEGKIPVPPSTLQLTKAMEAERKGLIKPTGKKKRRRRKKKTSEPSLGY